jgi:hypothetical protein
MGQFGLNLDEHSLPFGSKEADTQPLSHEELQEFRARIGKRRGSRPVIFTACLFVAGFAIGFMLLYFATGLNHYLRSALP